MYAHMRIQEPRGVSLRGVRTGKQPAEQGARREYRPYARDHRVT